MLPPDFAPWRSVYGYFRTWKLSGVWDKALTLFRETYRVQSGKNARPAAAIMDAQSVKGEREKTPYRGRYDGKSAGGVHALSGYTRSARCSVADDPAVRGVC